MSDFLARMAQIGRGEATLVQPRLPSLFSTQNEGAPTESVEPIMQQSDGSTKMPRRTAHSGTDSDRRPSAGEDVRPASHAADKTSTDAADMASAFTSLVPPPQENAPAPTGRLSSTAGILPEDHDEKTATAGHPPRRLKLADHLTSPPKAPSRATAPATGDDNLHVDPPANAPPIEGEPGANVPLVPDYRAPRRPPRQVMAEPPSPAEPAVEATPTVHINIGRIEVRAHTPTATPTPRPERPKPREGLSLDDYLKRGGGRS